MSKKTDTEIRAEWQALRAMKPSVPHFDRYKVSNWSAIDAMIQTLRYDYTLPEIHRRWSDADIAGPAEDARYWMDGGDVIAPAESWMSAISEKISA